MSEDGKAVKEERQPQESQSNAVEQSEAITEGTDATVEVATEVTGQDGERAPKSASPGGPTRLAPHVILVIFLFLMLLAGLIGASWYGWQLIQADKASLTRIAQQQAGARDDLSSGLADVRQRLSSLSDSVSQQHKSVSAKIGSTDEQVAALSKQLAKITDRLSRGDLAWHIAEIGFLLTRAQERLTVARDPKGALVALDLADERMAALARPELMPVRSAISQIRGQIAKANGFDRIGMALHLRRAADGVSDWPLKGVAVKAVAKKPASAGSGHAAAASSTEGSPWYQRAWDSTRSWFGRQFTVTRSNEPVKASARVATDRETRLWLTAVREALLARDVGGVGAAVDQGRQWIRDHYAVKSTAVADTLKALDQTRRDYADHPWPSMAKVFKAWDAAGLDHPRRIAREGLKKAAADARNGGAE